MVGERLLGHKAELGSEQAGIDLPRSPKHFEVDQGIELAHRAEIAHFGSLNA